MALSGRNIICFAGEDWWFHNPHSNLHLMKCFAADNRILFVNSTGIKMPETSDRFFWKRVRNKLKSLMRYCARAEHNIYVLTPFALPLVAGKEAQVQKINARLLNLQLRVVARSLGFKKPVLWVTAPVARDVAVALKKRWHSPLVYYCVDNLSSFPGVNKEFIAGLERGLMDNADLSFFVNEELLGERPSQAPKALLAHGVDYEHFARAATGGLPEPEDMQGIPRPIVGYIGEIKPLDFNLVRFLAEENPAMSFVFIGEIYAEIKGLNLPANVHFLGKKAYEDLPAYIQEFSCNCLYYDVNDAFNLYRNPKKLMEYFATGKPVVSVDIPQMQAFEDVVLVARSYEEFSSLLRKAVQTPDRTKIAWGMEIARKHTWEKIAERAGMRIAEVIDGKK